MTICDVCAAEVNRRIPGFNENQLSYIEGQLNSRLMLCKDCVSLCNYNHPECTLHKQAAKYYQNRSILDEIAINRIRQEKRKRVNEERQRRTRNQKR